MPAAKAATSGRSRATPKAGGSITVSERTNPGRAAAASRLITAP